MSRDDPTFWALLAAFAAVLLAACAEALLCSPGGTTATVRVGQVLVVLAAAWTINARRALGRSYAPTAHHPEPAQELVRTGPYRRFNHPMYHGNLLSVLGLLLALGAGWAWLTLPAFLAAQAWRIRREERFLRSRFGPAWSG